MKKSPIVNPEPGGLAGLRLDASKILAGSITAESLVINSGGITVQGKINPQVDPEIEEYIKKRYGKKTIKNIWGDHS